jgi:hypothetical protein
MRRLHCEPTASTVPVADCRRNGEDPLVMRGTRGKLGRAGGDSRGETPRERPAARCRSHCYQRHEARDMDRAQGRPRRLARH